MSRRPPLDKLKWIDSIDDSRLKINKLKKELSQ